MATQVQNRRGTTAEHSTFTGANGEVTVDTDKEVVVVHDGTTAGGYPQMRENGSNSALALGSAATPSLKFTGDTNTGIYSPGADQVAISTNGTGRLFVDASGRILSGISSSSADVNAIFQGTSGGSSGAGILIAARGTTTPNNGQALGILRFSDAGHVTAADIRSDRDGGTWTSGSSQPSRITFSTTPDGSATVQERLRITSDGKVGLGTSSPGQLLDVQGNSNPQLKVSETNNATSAGLFIENQGQRNWQLWADRATDTFRLGNNSRATTNIVVDSTGRVGVGTTSPGTTLDVAGNQRFSAANPVLEFNNGGPQIFLPGANTLAFATGGGIGTPTERARIDSSGRLLVGTSSARGFFNGTFSTGLQVEGTGSLRSLSVTSDETDGGGGAVVVLAHQKSGSVGGNTTLANNDALGALVFQGSNGSQMLEGASVSAFADGTISGGGAADLPTRLVFSTTADGASSPQERMRIDSTGTVSINGGGPLSLTRSAETLLFINRTTNDGTLVDFRQDGTGEGSISVSGTTVSYNGAHLSRWSQLPSGANRIEILRGTVLSNIDEMCEWGDEGNEQLNRMKVSDIEGDKNVSGVFQGWDDDDDTYTNDFYCAMTGDFIIRIGAGVTVERGDLLMSAGDGTAKPQDDDIIRSKTIAKVTSTNVSCTYDDGSYCVPCVLMAC